MEENSAPKATAAAHSRPVGAMRRARYSSAPIPTARRDVTPTSAEKERTQ